MIKLELPISDESYPYLKLILWFILVSGITCITIFYFDESGKIYEVLLKFTGIGALIEFIMSFFRGGGGDAPGNPPFTDWTSFKKQIDVNRMTDEEVILSNDDHHPIKSDESKVIFDAGDENEAGPSNITKKSSFEDIPVQPTPFAEPSNPFETPKKGKIREIYDQYFVSPDKIDNIKDSDKDSLESETDTKHKSENENIIDSSKNFFSPLSELDNEL